MTTTPLPEPYAYACTNHVSGIGPVETLHYKPQGDVSEHLYTADQLHAHAAAVTAAKDAEIAELKETVFQLNRALREATEAPTFMGEPVSLLRKPIKNLSELAVCYCPPGKCGAPVIMGRQTPCIRERAALKESKS